MQEDFTEVLQLFGVMFQQYKTMLRKLLTYDADRNVLPSERQRFEFWKDELQQMLGESLPAASSGHVPSDEVAAVLRSLVAHNDDGWAYSEYTLKDFCVYCSSEDKPLHALECPIVKGRAVLGL